MLIPKCEPDFTFPGFESTPLFYDSDDASGDRKPLFWQDCPILESKPSFLIGHPVPEVKIEDDAEWTEHPEEQRRYRGGNRRRNRNISHVKDPNCDPDWPLAGLWPVFVSNFHCVQSDQRDKAIRLFFASQGLRVRWWFSLGDDNPVQLQPGLFDMLVYFRTAKDAENAITRCDRSRYRGYTLNVLPGREPAYFPVDRSILFGNMRSGHVFGEKFLERHLEQRYGPINCVVRLDDSSCAVEFGSNLAACNAWDFEKHWQPMHVSQNFQKQRYLEHQITQPIMAFFSDHPTVLLAILQSLVTGGHSHPYDIMLPNESMTRKITSRKRGLNSRQRGGLNYKIKCIQTDIAKGLQPRLHGKDAHSRRLHRRLIEEVIFEYHKV